MQPEVPNTGLGYGSAGRNTVFKGASILEFALDTVSSEEKLRLVKAAERDPWLRLQISRNETFRNTLEKVAQVKTASVKIPDTSFGVLVKEAGGFSLIVPDGAGQPSKVATFANHEAPHLEEEKLAAIQMGAALVTTSSNPGRPLEDPSSSLVEVSETGFYSLMEKTGAATKGAVISNVVALSGEKTGLKLIVTPEGAALQEKVAGAKHGDIDFGKIAGAEPKGDGVFLIGSGDPGTVTEPVFVEHYITYNETSARDYIYQDSWGRKGVLKEAACAKILPIGGNDYIIPKGSKFISLEFTGGVLDSVDLMGKVASKEDTARKVELYADGSGYLFKGGGLNRLTRGMSVSYPVALFALGSLGLSADSADEKLAAATEDTPVVFLPPEVVQEKTAAPQVDLVPFVEEIKVNLIKAAAELPADQDTVDSVLALNFVTSDNISGFVAATPEYEACLNRLSELLVGARLGVPDVKESVVLTTLRALNRVVTSLKKLELRLSTME
jgi:hypothetical protein